MGFFFNFGEPPLARRFFFFYNHDNPSGLSAAKVLIFTQALMLVIPEINYILASRFA
jgi:hypothetical protein